jgi:uncharacterized OB-fold protein
MPDEERIDRIEMMEAPISLDYTFKPGAATTIFLRGLREGKLYGQRCPSCKNVIVPPRGACARCGVATLGDTIDLPDKGTVVTCTVVHIPIPGSDIKTPFVNASILLDGADIGIGHILSEVEIPDVRLGMRVQAKWKPREEWDYSLENIRYFAPIDEPDVDVATLGSKTHA